MLILVHIVKGYSMRYLLTNVFIDIFYQEVHKSAKALALRGKLPYVSLSLLPGKNIGKNISSLPYVFQLSTGRSAIMLESL